MSKYQFPQLPKKPLEEIIEIIKTVRGKITESTDIVWTRYSSVAELQQAIDAGLEKLLQGDTTVLEEFRLEFGPTSTFQEVSISNGWGEELIHLANRFDELYESRDNWK